jgi:hypothetical protein
MLKPEHYLYAGGLISALISVLHVLFALRPALYRYVSAGRESPLAEMAVRGSTPTTIATVALALLFAVWAAYAFSGAGVVGALPALRFGLIAIAVIYILRGLFIPTEVNMVLHQEAPLRFVVFSTISLAAGLLYLIGFFRLGGA